MQERTWLKALPKIEKELELIKICVDTLQVIAILPTTPTTSTIQSNAENILMRYFQQLDVLTRPNEKPIKVELDDN
jgi:hypothetical protein